MIYFILVSETDQYQIILYRGKNESFGFRNDANNLITHVHPGGPAENHGQMKKGDKIYSINGLVTLHGNDTNQILKTCSSPVALVINRLGKNTKNYILMNNLAKPIHTNLE